MTEVKNRFTSYIRELQDTICRRLENVDGYAKFIEDNWNRAEGGGGISRIIESGKVFEKGGVNTSEVYGDLPEMLQLKLGLPVGCSFFACGISIVLHPESPMIPTVHANYRMFEVYDKDGKRIDRWFGGGADLTPYYIYEADAVHFHLTHKRSCDSFGLDIYPTFKEDCDNYFFNAHRQEPRGIGGIFFDYLRATSSITSEDCLALVMSCGDSFLGSYLPIVEKRLKEPWSERHREWQEYRRGRYVEFNLIHDRGTLFGLKTNGRIESILMSLPPRVRWKYNYVPKPGSREEELVKALHHKNWIKVYNDHEVPINEK